MGDDGIAYLSYTIKILFPNRYNGRHVTPQQPHRLQNPQEGTPPMHQIQPQPIRAVEEPRRGLPHQ